MPQTPVATQHEDSTRKASRDWRDDQLGLGGSRVREARWEESKPCVQSLGVEDGLFRTTVNWTQSWRVRW